MITTTTATLLCKAQAIQIREAALASRINAREQQIPLLFLANHNQDASSSSTIPYGLDKKAIISDLTTERPQWILSAYGPGRQAPAQLFGGPLREQSFEEMRLAHYMGMAAGNPQQAVRKIWKMYSYLFILSRSKKQKSCTRQRSNKFRRH